MCRICEGNAPSPPDFGSFRSRILEARESVRSLDDFITNAMALDRERFETGVEWGEPYQRQHLIQYILSNPNPDEGLLLFTLCCWLDMQAPYKMVWTKYLEQASRWINGTGDVPRKNFHLTKVHLLLTKRTAEKYGSISLWFIQAINRIAKKYGHASGNLYRLAGEICGDFYAKPDVSPLLKEGLLPKEFSGGDAKRFWMFMMLLRRDNSVLKCLFTRALSHHPNGMQALQYWYDIGYFDPSKCELPVDSHVLENWNNLLDRIGVRSFCGRNPKDVAVQARRIAQQFNVSPSTFDAMMFF